MTEREILKLAAAAYFGEDGFRWNPGADLIEYIPKDSCHYVSWKPLIDDGDALRLAVKLEMVLEMNSTSCGALITKIGGDWCYESVLGCGGAEAATRRAVVRAAAESVETN